MPITQGGWGRNIPPAKHFPIVFAGRNTHIARVLSLGLPDSQVEANCTLIAHADQLLNALRRLAHPMADDSDLQNALELLNKLKDC